MAGKEKKVSFIITAQDRASKVINSVRAGLSSIGKGLSVGTASIVSGLGAVAASLGFVVAKALQFAGSLKDTSDRLGIATDQLAALRYAGEQAGISIEDTDKALKFMLKNLSSTGVDAKKKLGKDGIEKLKDELKSIEKLEKEEIRRKEKIEDINKKISELKENKTDKNKEATEKKIKNARKEIEEISKTISRPSAAAEEIKAKIAEAESSVSDLSNAFKQLGLDANKLKNQSPQKSFIEIVTALEKMENPADRMRLAMDIFGKSGGQVLTHTAEGLEKATAEAYKFGIALDQATAGRLEELGDSWDKIKASVVGAGLSFTAVLAGPLEKAAAKVEEFTTSGKMKKWAAEAGAAVINVAATIVRIIPQALLLVLEIMGKISMGFRGWQMLWTELRFQFAGFMEFLWSGLNLLRTGITGTLEALNVNGVFDEQIAESKRVASEQQIILAAIKADRKEQLRLQQETIRKSGEEQAAITQMGQKAAAAQKYFDELADSLTFGDKIVEQTNKALDALDKLQAKQKWVSLGSARAAKPGQTQFGDEHRLREMERTE